ncbi:MAG: metal dependent phosphohydrolase [Ignavibacteria bacterium]|nr:MAG: metal dependent phosphohydrolase [Ignavibacteria bacterium]KAF0161896.1 MAG: metal dependent phosphohydrolase [Ignavibacteria bacterium]
MLLQLAEEYAVKIILERSPKQNLYHSIEHTKEVVNAAIEIAKGESVSEEDIEIVTLAAWFHDLGYVEKTAGHEEISAMFASNFLLNQNYDESKIEKVVGCIMATKVPQRPKNHLEKIMCDADLNHLGKKSFIGRNNLFRTEFEFYFKRRLTESEWLIKSIEFVSQHNFFTDYAQKTFSEIRNANLALLQLQLDSLN